MSQLRMRIFAGCALLLGCGLPLAAAADEAAAPYVLSAAYTGEAWSTLEGGAKSGQAYLEKIEAALEVDAEAAWGLPGVTALVSGLYTNGASISGDYVGDLQGVSNIEGDGALRLYEAWARRAWSGGSLKAGVIDLNSEFDVNEVGALFVNSAHGIAPDFSQAGHNGPSIFPVTGLGAVGEAALSPTWRVKAGVFDGTPGDLDRPRRNAFGLSRAGGALLVGEVARTAGRANLVVGAWRHTAWRDGAEPGRGSGADSYGAYGLVGGRVHEDARGRLDGFLRVGAAQGGEIGRYLGAGLVYSGPALPGESAQLGLAVAAARLDGDARRRREALGEATDWGELNAELTYRVEIAPWAALQPSLQYVANPGAVRGVADAWVVGVRLEIFGARGFGRREGVR